MNGRGFAAGLVQRLRWDLGDEASDVNSYDPATMARTFIYLYGAGGSLVLLSLLLPHPMSRWEPGLVGPAVSAIGVAALLAAWFERAPRWVFLALPPLGTVLIAVVLYSSGGGSLTIYAGLYFWVALSAFSFFPLRVGVLNLIWVGISYAAVLAATPDANLVELRWLMVVGTVTVAGLVMAALRARVERLVFSLRRRSLKQQKVAELGRLGVGGAGLPELSHSAASAITECLGVEHAALLQTLPGGEEMLVKTGVGWDPGLSGTTTVPQDSMVQQALDATTEPAVAERHAQDLEEGPKGPLNAVASAIGVAIPGSPEPYGVLAAYSSEPRSFSRTDAAFLQAIAHVLGDAIERHRHEEAIHHRALHDHLTGRPNRTLFGDRLQEALIRRHEGQSLVAIFFLDIDDFKLVNDGFGHGAGDELLRAFGPRLREALVMTDTVARFGGDEFAVLCEGVVNEQHALEIADRLLESVAEPFEIAGAAYRVSASAGIALAGNGVGAEELVAQADAAMYLAKERNRGGHEFFDGELRERVRLRLQFESALRSAPDDDQLQLVAQPIVSLPDHQPTGSEVLLRWRHPELGAVSPADFIPVAEETGAIIPIGDWVLQEAFSLSARLRSDPRSRMLLPLHVNISLRQLSQQDFVHSVREKLARTGARIRDIAFEITEHALLADASGTVQTLGELQEMGFAIVLDDFGTGYSSLSYLKNFPLDTVKIDRFFVSNLINERKDEAIVAAVLGMADAFALDVIAEGIETVDQAQRLSQLGCRFGQGFLFSRPVPPEKLLAMEFGDLSSQPASDSSPAASRAASLES